jgi:hypothetical protein
VRGQSRFEDFGANQIPRDSLKFCTRTNSTTGVDDTAAADADEDGDEVGEVDEDVHEGFAPMASSDDPEGNTGSSAEDLNGSLTEVRTIAFTRAGTHAHGILCSAASVHPGRGHAVPGAAQPWPDHQPKLFPTRSFQSLNARTNPIGI